MSYEFIRSLYSMKDLEIVRFGLNTDFIEDNNLLWIDGLETSSGKDLNDPGHPDHNKPHVQQYLAEHRPRKVEANALITRPEAALELISNVLDEYIDAEGVERWEAENREASKEAREKVEHLIKMLTFLDTQGWLYSGHKLEAAAEIHRAKTLRDRRLTLRLKPSFTTAPSAPPVGLRYGAQYGRRMTVIGLPRRPTLISSSK